MTSKQTIKARKGSALILTVVLTSLLAVVAGAFMLLARMDRKGASAALRSKELDLAVRSVLDEIREELALDMPGESEGDEYYDAPDPCDPWLASLEPYQKVDDGPFYWAQVSRLPGGQLDNRDILLETPDCYIVDFPWPIDEGDLADADGDGIADSLWMVDPDLQTDRGAPVYVAVRIIDHGAMLNVNTGYDFDTLRFNPEAKQMQVDLTYLGARSYDGDPNESEKADIIDELNGYRIRDYNDQSEPNQFVDYRDSVVLNFNGWQDQYSLFDISDELKLRYRFVLDDDEISTRIGDLWSENNAFYGGPQTQIHTGYSDYAFSDWTELLTLESNPSSTRRNYDYRHISTTINAEALISASESGDLQANLNEASAQVIYERLVEAADPNESVNRVRLAQLAANLYDFLHPSQDEPSLVNPQTGDPNVYGFMPQPFISEIVCRLDPNEPGNPAKNFFAVELVNPFDVSLDASDWSLQLIYDVPGDVNEVISLSSLGEFPAGQHKVIVNDASVGGVVDANSDSLVLATFDNTPTLNYGCTIVLKRQLASGVSLIMDKQVVFDNWLKNLVIGNRGDFVSLYRYDGLEGGSDSASLYSVAYVPQSEDINECGFDISEAISTLALGRGNSSITYYSEDDDKDMWNLPRRSDYSSEGGGYALSTPVDLLRIPIVGPSTEVADKTVGQWLSDPDTQESDLFLDLVDKHRVLSRLFQGVTVYDTAPGRVKGRVNVNTAPEFVLQRLPWMNVELKDDDGNPVDTNEAAHAIVTGRMDGDKFDAYESIGDLLLLPEFRCFGVDGVDNSRKDPALVDPCDPNDLGLLEDQTSVYFQPDETFDNSIDDFEEEQLLLSLVSNQVAVRSDVFTAYLLIRLGDHQDAPQRRMMAILDRSNAQEGSGETVKVLALVPVADTR